MTPFDLDAKLREAPYCFRKNDSTTDRDYWTFYQSDLDSLVASAQESARQEQREKDAVIAEQFHFKDSAAEAFTGKRVAAAIRGQAGGKG